MHSVAERIESSFCSPQAALQIFNAWGYLNISAIRDQCAIAMNCESTFVETLSTQIGNWLGRVTQTVDHAMDGLTQIVKKVLSSEQRQVPIKT